MPRMTMNDPQFSSSSFLKCFEFKPNPLAWSFVRQTLISYCNNDDLVKEAPKSSISDLESILKDVKLLTTFQNGNATDGNPVPSNDCGSNNIKLSNDYTEDEIKLLKIVSTCLVPQSNSYKIDIGLQDGPSLNENGDDILQERPLVSENDISIAQKQNVPSFSVARDDILHKGPLVSKKNNCIVQDVPLVPNSNDISQEAPPLTENGNEIMQDGCPENGNTRMPRGLPVMKNADQIMPVGHQINPICDAHMPKVPSLTVTRDDILHEDPSVPTNSNHDVLQKDPPVTENRNEIMQNGCPFVENDNTSIPKGLPVMENADQITPKGPQINQICDAYMSKVHPVTENGDENISEQHLITENSNGTMHGPSFTGIVDGNLQAPTENDNGGTLPRNFCLKCHRGGSLIMCEVENCFTSFHERCVVYLERSELGTFKCPLCFYKHAAMAYQVARKRCSQAKKSLVCFLKKDEMDNRIDKRKSAKANGDRNASVSNRKCRKKTEMIQVKIEAVETEVYHNGSEANSVQEQVTKDDTVNLDKGKKKADLNAVSTINGTHEKGETTLIQSKDMPQDVLNMPVHKARAETIPNGGGRNPHISKSENQHTGINSKSKNVDKFSCNDTKGYKRPNTETSEHQGRLPKQCRENTFRYHDKGTSK